MKLNVYSPHRTYPPKIEYLGGGVYSSAVSFALDKVASFALDKVASFALDKVASFA